MTKNIRFSKDLKVSAVRTSKEDKLSLEEKLIVLLHLYIFLKGVSISAGTKDIRETVPDARRKEDKCTLTMSCFGSKSTFLKFHSMRAIIKGILLLASLSASQFFVATLLASLLATGLASLIASLLASWFLKRMSKKRRTTTYRES